MTSIILVFYEMVRASITYLLSKEQIFNMRKRYTRSN